MANKFEFDIKLRMKDGQIASDGNIQHYSIEKFGLENGGRAQMTLDSEVLRKMDPYIPFDTGMLIIDGILSTEIGSGIIKYTLPYARKQYYIPMDHSGTDHPSACDYWFEKMKTDHKEELLNIVRKAMNS